MSDATPVKGNPKAVNQYARRHPFFRSSTGRFTTSERRAFERDVYDYARALGLTTKEAKGRVMKARDLCGDEGDDAEGSALENEVNDSECILQALKAKLEPPSTERGRDKSNGTTNVGLRQPSTLHSSGFFDATSTLEKSASSSSKRRLSTEPDWLNGQTKPKKQRIEAKTSELRAQPQANRSTQTECVEKSAPKVSGDRPSRPKAQPSPGIEATTAHTLENGQHQTKPSKKPAERTMKQTNDAEQKPSPFLNTDTTSTESETTINTVRRSGSARGEPSMMLQNQDYASIDERVPNAASSQYKQSQADSSGAFQDDTQGFPNGPEPVQQDTLNTEETSRRTPMTKKEKTAQRKGEQEKRKKFFDDLLQERRDAQNSPGPADLIHKQNEDILELEPGPANVEVTGDILQLQQKTIEANKPAKHKKEKKKNDVKDVKYPRSIQDMERKKKSKKKKTSVDISEATPHKKEKKRRKSPGAREKEAIYEASESTMSKDSSTVPLEGAMDNSITKPSEIPWDGEDVEQREDFRAPMIPAK